MSAAPSAGIATVVTPGRVDQSGRFSTSPSRPVVMMSTADCAAVVSIRCSSRSRNVASALCTSSRHTTTGLRVEIASRNLRAPQNSSVTGNRAVERPATDARRSRISAAPATPSSVASIRSTARSGVSSSTIPVAARIISTSGQNVMPSP